jgi:hypothetical protein
MRRKERKFSVDSEYQTDFSRDIERSLDTTLAVFCKNLTFMDEYLLRKYFFDMQFFVDAQKQSELSKFTT